MVPTPAFFYGMKNNEEILIEIGKGKTLIVRLLYVGDADESGMRTVYFRLNGQTRAIEVKDTKTKITKHSNTKISDNTKHVGAPMQGMLSKIFVKEGEAIKKNQPLFTIEAMKMETTITSTRDFTVTKIVLKEKTLVEQDDLVIEV